MNFLNKPLLLGILTLLILYSNNLKSQVFKVDTSYKANDLVSNYFLSKNHIGVKIKNINSRGIKNALGLFYYASNYSCFPSSGIILSTGYALDAMGPNKITASNENHTEGDNDLSMISNSKTFDASILEFDFISLSDSISFIFQFASEEYPEYVNRGVSDIFGFIVTDPLTGKKENIAVFTKNKIPITIDLINSTINTDFYNSNNTLEYSFHDDYKKDLKFYENMSLFQFDGYTKPIVSGLKLAPYKQYHFKIVIADVGDMKFDSWIFLKANSFESNGKKINPSVDELLEYFKFLNDDSIKIFSENEEIHLFSPIYFKFNSFIIGKSSLPILDNINDIMNYCDYKLLVNGYTDEKGAGEYNQVLSQKRADEVKNYLIKSGIPSERIQAAGKGEVNSVNIDKSRKVEFILYKKSPL